MTRTATDGSGSRSRWFARSVTALPDRILLVLLAAVLAVSIAVTANLFTPWLVVPLFLVALAVLWRFMPARPGVGRADAWGAGIAVIIAIVWIGVNVPYTSQLLDATRDPSLYTLVGIWLTHHTSPAIDVSTASNAISGLHSFTVNLQAFGADGTEIHIQGGATLPALLAVGGWLLGTPGVLVTNIGLGAVGLIAMYSLARRFVSPAFALACEIALGVSVAMMFLSRAPYSETVMLFTCAAGLVWMVGAIREGKTSLWVVSGIFLGSAGFARVDGPLAVIGPSAAILVAAFVVRDGTQLDSITRGARWFALAAVSAEFLGWLGLAINEAGYLHDLGSQTLLVWGAMLLTVVAAIVAVGLRSKVKRFGALPDRATRIVAAVGGIGFVAVFLYWLSRPLWLISRHTTAPFQPTIAALQAVDGLPIDPSRSYDEMSLSWIAWYFGWPTLLLAGFGLALMIYLGVSRRRATLLVIAGATLSVAALYISRISITPDQAWAYRRLLPIITPGFLLAAVYPLHLAVRRWGRRGIVRFGAYAVAVVVAFTPLVTWNGLLRVPDGDNGYSFATSMCKGITGDTVLLVTKGTPPFYALTLRMMCDVNVISTSDETTQADLAQLKKRIPGISVITFGPDTIAGTANLPDPTGGNHITRWATSLAHLPNSLNTSTVQFWSGTLDDSGSFVPRG